jgi:hypothetical protein
MEMRSTSGGDVVQRAEGFQTSITVDFYRMLSKVTRDSRPKTRDSRLETVVR